MIIRGRDWSVEIFSTGSQCWNFPITDNERISECIKEMNIALEKYYRAEDIQKTLKNSNLSENERRKLETEKSELEKKIIAEVI